MSPKLFAEFETSKDGKPIAVPGETKKHYRIRLFLKDVPPDAYSVTYQLDKSYRNPIRKIPSGVPEFEEYTTSYGDYPVSVEIRGRDFPYSLREMLSNALENRYGAEANPEIRGAIEAIKQN